MAEKTFDLIVIGAGPGGYVAAIRAAQLGMQVACVDKYGLGGTCLNVGCIPSKALLESSELYYQAQTAFAAHGIKASEVSLNLKAMMKRKSDIVKRMTAGIRGLFRKNEVTAIAGVARLLGKGQVGVAGEKGEEVLQGERILIATGSSPIELPGLPFDGERIISSTEALVLDEAPQKLLVVGAGAIGLELGSVWQRLGAQVQVVEFLNRITPGMDRELSDGLQKLLEKQGLTFMMETKAESAEIVDGALRVSLKQGDQTLNATCDQVLVAVGRRPNVAGLGVEEAGVELDEKGRVAVNEQFETSAAGIYAIGDVIAGPMLAHKAEEEGVAAVEMMMGKAGHVNYEAIPNVVYTHPELASVGLTEEQVKEQGIPHRVGRFPFLANGRAHSLGATEGLVKLIAHEKTDRVLGLHILGARASEILAEGVLAMEFAGSAEDLARTMHAHPTLPEAIKEAALAVDGRAIHV